MTEKIFKAIFISCIVTMLSCFGFFIGVLYLRHEQGVWFMLLEYISPILFMVVAIIIASLIVALVVAGKIVKPINQINPDNPAKDNVYDEIEPLLKKIRAQNKRISREKQKLSKSREEFRIITENMSEGLIIIDNKANIISCNKAAERMLAGNTNETVGKNIFTLNHTNTLVAAVEEALRGESGEHILTAGERIYQIILNSVIVEDSLAGAFLIIMDITEKEQRDTLRREFTSNVSHELKTPLTSIYGISDMLASGMVKPEDVKGFAGDINREADRLIHLVEDIIHLSRLDEGGFSSDMESVQLENTIAEVLLSLKPTAEQSEIELISNLSPVTVTGHPTILNEIVFNLLDNAIKYNSPGGYVKISLKSTDNAAEITVEDNGIGIPKDHQNRIFERFYRVDKSHSKAKKGTGLGLSIVKHGIAYHGGKITLESTEGKGTTINITLPLETPTQTHGV